MSEKTGFARLWEKFVSFLELGWRYIISAAIVIIILLTDSTFQAIYVACEDKIKEVGFWAPIFSSKWELFGDLFLINIGYLIKGWIRKP